MHTVQKLPRATPCEGWGGATLASPRTGAPVHAYSTCDACLYWVGSDIIWGCVCQRACTCKAVPHLKGGENIH